MQNSPTTEIRPPFWWIRWIPAALLICSLVAVAIAIGGNVIMPLMVSFALAFLLEPVVERFQKWGRSRIVAVLLTLGGAVLVVTLALFFLVPGIYHQLVESIEKLPLALRAVASRTQLVLGYAREHLNPEVFARLQTTVSNFENDPSALTSRIGGWLSRGLLGLVSFGSWALGMLIIPFFVYYLLMDMGNLRRILEERIPGRYRWVGNRLFDEIGHVVRVYIHGRILMAIIIASIYAIGLFILKVPLWAGIGLMAGLLGIIPYLGVISGLILALGFAALDGAGLWRLAGVCAVFAIGQFIEDYMLTPRIIGNKLELHPMIVFIGLIIAGDLFGLIGLVLAIPALAVSKVLIRFLDELYLRSDFYLTPASVIGKDAVQSPAEPFILAATPVVAIEPVVETHASQPKGP